MDSNDKGNMFAIEQALDEEGKDITDYKAYAEKFQGLGKRYHGKYNKYKAMAEKPKENPLEKKVENKTGEFDYAQKAFLNANGIKGADELEMAKTFMGATGKSLDEVVDNKYFQAELKDFRDNKASKEAIPTGSKRSGGVAAKDTTEYWINKGELPPADQVELRRAVVNAKYKSQKGTDPFAKK